MKTLRQAISAVLPTSWDLRWSRSAIQRGYEPQIEAARQARDHKAVAQLEDSKRWELQLIDELEDEQLTAALLKKARRLKVPIPRRWSKDGAESEHWYQGSQTGQWYLTVLGAQSIRREIREEQRQIHELRSRLLPWLTAISGVIGTLTGLIAILGSR